jgi:hypothetical protein
MDFFTILNQFARRHRNQTRIDKIITNRQIRLKHPTTQHNLTNETMPARHAHWPNVHRRQLRLTAAIPANHLLNPRHLQGHLHLRPPECPDEPHRHGRVPGYFQR